VLIKNIQQVTYSPAYTLVPTYECFNRCSYCNFRAEPNQSPWLSLETARTILEKLETLEISPTCEILMLSGEVHPQSKRRMAWLQHIYDLCALALTMGFLPHTNVGPLSFEEMQQLKQVNVSMGLMLEQLTPKLLATVHRQAPSKDPELRLQQLTWAGQLRIPFTTGLLIGIGESPEDWKQTLLAIATLHHQYQHIQEVIIQPHQIGVTQSLQEAACDDGTLLQAVQLARDLLPSDITLQIPPNLLQGEQTLIDCLNAGVRDLGGIGPKDEVNPSYPHQTLTHLKAQLSIEQWRLVPRLPIYPQYDEWLPASLQAAIQPWRRRFAL
jgi:7,8-didemethyl-8-hydroxy-5-deazariboflavin synthase